MSLPLRRPSRDADLVDPADLADPAVPRAPRRRFPFRASRRAAALGIAALTTVGAAAPPSPGPQGIGDRLFPALGNPGYDVVSYDVALDYPGRNDRPLNAVTKITAHATT